MIEVHLCVFLFVLLLCGQRTNFISHHSTSLLAVTWYFILKTIACVTYNVKLILNEMPKTLWAALSVHSLDFDNMCIKQVFFSRWNVEKSIIVTYFFRCSTKLVVLTVSNNGLCIYLFDFDCAIGSDIMSL